VLLHCFQFRLQNSYISFRTFSSSLFSFALFLSIYLVLYFIKSFYRILSLRLIYVVILRFFFCVLSLLIYFFIFRWACFTSLLAYFVNFLLFLNRSVLCCMICALLGFLLSPHCDNPLNYNILLAMSFLLGSSTYLTVYRTSGLNFLISAAAILTLSVPHHTPYVSHCRTSPLAWQTVYIVSRICTWAFFTKLYAY